MADIDSLAALLGQLASSGGGAENGGSTGNNSGNNDGGGHTDEPEDIFGDIDIETIMKLMDAFSQLGSEDKNTRLLLALKPHLKNENRAKVDRAVKLMKLMSVFMLLRESGLADKLL